jgi:hypothetical protein
MPELSENEVNRRLLAEVEVALTGKIERAVNIKSSVAGLKKKLIECVDKGLWDQAHDILNQTNKLSVDNIAADADVVQAQARVDGLKAAIVKAEEKARLAAIPPPYKPYSAEPVLVPAPASVPAVAQIVAEPVAAPAAVEPVVATVIPETAG